MCEVCLRLENIKNGKNPCFVTELETGYVVFGDFQRFTGYTLFLCKEHVREVYDLDVEMKVKHLMEMSLVAEAVANVFEPDKMNYESLGNGIAHLHWHFFPRRVGDMEMSGPVWWLGKEELYHEKHKVTPQFLDEFIPKLQQEIDALQ